MTDDDRMDALLRQMAAEDYHRPPDIVPREQMWEAVRQGLATAESGNREQGTGNGSHSSLVRRIPRWVYLAAAAVLLLAVGIQVGRTLGSRAGAGPEKGMAQTRDSLPAPQRLPQDDAAPQPDRDVAVTDDGTKGRPKPRPEPERFAPTSPNDATEAYTITTAAHLMQAEALLTTFKSDLNQGRMDTQIAAWGKDLLSNTRLLLDSPAATDPVRRKLLQDLELVLVQIVQLSPGTSARDRDLIKGALTDDQVLTRLRTAIPAQKGT